MVEREREWQTREEEVTPRVGSHPLPEILITEISDYRTYLFAGVGNTDVCPGRHTPSRRHCRIFIHYNEPN